MTYARTWEKVECINHVNTAHAHCMLGGRVTKDPHSEYVVLIAFTRLNVTCRRVFPVLIIITDLSA
jgi:hypothetical protein